MRRIQLRYEDAIVYVDVELGENAQIIYGKLRQTPTVGEKIEEITTNSVTVRVFKEEDDAEG